MDMNGRKMKQKHEPTTHGPAVMLPQSSPEHLAPFRDHRVVHVVRTCVAHRACRLGEGWGRLGVKDGPMPGCWRACCTLVSLA